MNGALFFTANDGDVRHTELWKSDGTAAGTVLVKDIHPADRVCPPVADERERHAVLQGRRRRPAARELWKSDGTEAGTVLVKDIHPGAAAPTRVT